MFLSSSFIIVEIKGSLSIGELLKNSYFKEQKPMKEDYAFYSINFYNDEKNIGEIHWSESFNYGKMNLINFMRRENKFFLFTSSVQNYKVLEYLLERILHHKIDLEVIKIPLEYKLETPKINEIVSIEGQNIFGISVILLINGKYSLLKIYTNGVITYSMTNDQIIIENTIDVTLKLIESIKGSDGA